MCICGEVVIVPTAAPDVAQVETINQLNLPNVRLTRSVTGCFSRSSFLFLPPAAVCPLGLSLFLASTTDSAFLRLVLSSVFIFFSCVILTAINLFFFYVYPLQFQLSTLLNTLIVSSSSISNPYVLSRSLPWMMMLQSSVILPSFYGFLVVSVSTPRLRPPQCLGES